MLWRCYFGTPMNSLVYVSWVLGPALQITLLWFMLRQKLQSVFPRFFAYILFQVLKSCVLFGISHFSSDNYSSDNYFYAYWAGNAVSVLLAVTVLDEIWRNLFKPYEGLQRLGSLIFRWACAVLLLIAVSSAISGQGAVADRVTSAVLNFDRSMRLLQCGLFLLLVLLCHYLKHFWRQHVFGIALGFGIFASIELILVSVLLRYGDAQIDLMSLLKGTTYNLVTLLWIAYLRQHRPVPVTAPELRDWSFALAGPQKIDDTPSFITMVEQAAERVLARSTWLGPPHRKSRVVARRPRADDNN